MYLVLQLVIFFLLSLFFQLRIPADQQDWFFKGRKLDDMQTLYDRGVKKDNKITVKQKQLEVVDQEIDEQYKLNEAVGGNYLE